MKITMWDFFLVQLYTLQMKAQSEIEGLYEWDAETTESQQ